MSLAVYEASLARVSDVFKCSESCNLAVDLDSERVPNEATKHFGTTYRVGLEDPAFPFPWLDEQVKPNLQLLTFIKGDSINSFDAKITFGVQGHGRRWWKATACAGMLRPRRTKRIEKHSAAIRALIVEAVRAANGTVGGASELDTRQRPAIHSIVMYEYGVPSLFDPVTWRSAEKAQLGRHVPSACVYHVSRGPKSEQAETPIRHSSFLNWSPVARFQPSAIECDLGPSGSLCWALVRSTSG